MNREEKQKEKRKKIVFSEEIDSRIDGLTLGLAFIVIGLFLLFVPDYFGHEIIGIIIRWIFIVIGVLGLFVEFRKVKPVSNIKGFDDLWLGVLFLAFWAAVFVIAGKTQWNIVGFLGLVLGTYGTCRGMFTITYSIYSSSKKKEQSKSTIISDIIVFATKVISLALVVMQFVKAIQ